MSRSYGKFAPGFTLRDWCPAMRSRERECIHREMRNPEYGDVVFPIISEVSDPQADDCYHCLYEKKEIRDGYFKEIKNILNGYYGRYEGGCNENFLESFHRIEDPVPSDGRGSPFEWLNFKEAKTIIKGWTGDPIDVLYYLTRAKVIEKAVNRELRRRVRK
jgi:hypothetical protein